MALGCRHERFSFVHLHSFCLVSLTSCNMGIGDVRKCVALESIDDLETIKLWGPVVASEENVNQKLFTFCRDTFPDISKRTLHYCFKNGLVSVNGINLVADGYGHETRRLTPGDTVAISILWKNIILTCQQYMDVDIILEDEQFAVVHKPAGLDVYRAGIFSVCCRLKIWGGESFHTASQLFDVPKNHSGIIVFARDPVCQAHAYRSIHDGSLYFECTALVCSRIPQNETIDVSIDISQESSSILSGFSLTGHHVVPSRGRDFISLVTIRPVLSSTLLVTSHNPAAILTQATQSLARTMARHNYQIVGHEGTLNSNHGIYSSWTRMIRQLSPNETSVVSIPIPSKFTKFMLTEERLYQKALDQAYSTEIDIQHLLSLQNISLSSATSAAPTKCTDEHPESTPPSIATTSSTMTSSEAMRPAEEYALFCGYLFDVSRAVMMPRPSSATLVHAICNHLVPTLSSVDSEAVPLDSRSIRIVDLGTGSGCLLIATMLQLMSRGVAHESIYGLGLDLSPSALAIAARNAHRHALQDQCHFAEADFSSRESIYEAVSRHQRGPLQPIDVIVCNPPYSSRREKNRLSHAVINRDPDTALFAHATDPLWAYRCLAQSLTQPAAEVLDDAVRIEKSFGQQSGPQLPLLHGKSLLVLEVGHGQAEAVCRIFAEASCCGGVHRGSWKYLSTKLDHKGMARALLFTFQRYEE